MHQAIKDRLGLNQQQLARFLADLWREYLGTANTQLIEYARRLRPRYRTGILSNSFVGAREREQAAYGVPTLALGRVRIATGTLYTALDRLAAEGYVQLVSEDIVSSRVRRSYGLTDPGASALRAEAARMAEAARVVTDGTAARASRPGRRTGQVGGARSAGLGRTARTA